MGISYTEKGLEGMTLVQLVDVKKSFGTYEILRGVDARIFSHSRIGLIGANGTGKTTLLQIILGNLEEDSGEVIKQRNLKIAYLPQIPTLHEQNNVLQEAMRANEELFHLDQEMQKVEKKLADATGADMDRLINGHAQLVELFERKGGYRYRADIEAILDKLGFLQSDFSLPVHALSGGQKNRLGLVCTLLENKDILLLDEPTNFLDLQSTEWLETHLKTSSSAMLIISHDRYFLNQVVNEIWDINNGKVDCYKGNYDSYCVQKQQKEERQQELYERQQEEIHRQEEFIRRNFYGLKHRQAQSRRRGLERMERLQPVVNKAQAPRFTMCHETSKAGRILEVTNLGHNFDTHLLFKDLSFALEREEKMAVIGPNGCGKSTLLHIILGKLCPTDGSAEISPQVRVGFYHQELQDLDYEINVFETIKKLSPLTDDKPLRDFLATFLFRNEDIYKKVKELSGGEKSRLAMAKLLMQKPDFLILDEPTNHLDILSRQALEQALQDYAGTLLFVSHDRYFIDKVASCMLIYHRQGWILFYGNYSQFQASREYLIPETTGSNRPKRTAHQNIVKSTSIKKKRKYSLEQIEEEIIHAETRLAEITEQLGNEAIYQEPNKVRELSQEYDSVNEQLAELNKEWESWEA